MKNSINNKLHLSQYQVKAVLVHMAASKKQCRFAGAYLKTLVQSQRLYKASNEIVTENTQSPLLLTGLMELNTGWSK
jgi:hypothetical protein